jgi:hypothetical protein
MKNLLIVLLVSSCLTAQDKFPIVGNKNAVAGSGIWQENHEGVGLLCNHITTAEEVAKGSSEAVCFVVEAQALGKDDVQISRNLLMVKTWDKHGLTAITDFYFDKQGNEATASTPNAMHATFRLVINFDTHLATKYVEFPTKTLAYHLQ